MDARAGGGPGRTVRIPEQAERREAAEPRPGAGAVEAADTAAVENSREQGDAERYAVLGED